MKLDINFNEQRAESLGLAGWPARASRESSRKSPAERANLQVNDVILEFNGVRIEQDMHLISLVKLTRNRPPRAADRLRDGKLVRIDVEIADASSYRDAEEVSSQRRADSRRSASDARMMWSVTAAVSISTATSIFGRLSGFRRRSNTVRRT